MNRDQLIRACRVPDTVPAAIRGPWEIYRFPIPDLAPAVLEHLGFVDREHYTGLFRHTLATLHQGFGECVMEDTFRELRRHLPILLAASGNVLVTGLGLGCVVRGLLAKPEVRHVDVIELDPAIIQLVGPSFSDQADRCTIWHGDARTIPFMRDRWDYAWHDVWSETESLAVVHMKLMERFYDRAAIQGAWMFPRLATRSLPHRFIGGPRRRRVDPSWHEKAAAT